MKEFFIAFGAVTFGAASIVIAPFIDTILASLLPTGSRTALYYADRINQLPLGVLGIALGTVLLPEMSARLAKGDAAGSDFAQNRSAAMSLLLTLPFMVAFLAIPGIIIRAVFLHGAFNTAAAQLATFALMAYGAGLPAMALLRIVQATFYARHDTMTPARATVIALVSNIALKLLFVWGLKLGVAGLALGTGLGAWINVLLLTWTGKSRALLAIERQFLRALPVALLAALACGVGARIGAGLGQMAMPGRWRDVAGLAVAILCAGLCYGTVIVLFRHRLPLRRAA
jgi:putative peptidoglycan lipid II flippase